MNVQNPSASRGIAIQAVDLVKNYGTGSNMVHALRGVNVSFERGKFTAIMGPSGSGKSTLMHTLAGLDSATSGHILFGGARPDPHGRQAAHLATSPQDRLHLPKLQPAADVHRRTEHPHAS